MSEATQLSASEQKKEDWMNAKWRPMMGWMYMVVCFCDFVVFPVLWSLHQSLSHGNVASQWAPLTLNGAGLFHIAMGAVLGIAAMGRTQEKLAGANNGGAATTSSTPSFMPSFGNTPSPSAPAPSFGNQPLGGNSASTAPAFTPAPAPAFGAKPIGPAPAAQPEL